MTTPIQMLEASVSGCVAEVFLNGWPIERLTPDGLPRVSRPVNHFLVDGKNRIAVVVEPGPIPSRYLEPREVAREELRGLREVHVTLKDHAPGSLPSEQPGTPLMELRWSSVDAPPAGLPHLLTADADLGRRHGSWSWQFAPELALDAALEQEVRELLTGFHRGLAARDPEPYLSRAALRFQEAARAFGDPAEVAREVFVEDLADDSASESWDSAGGWALEPLDPATEDLRLVAGSRVVECVARDWQPILRSVRGSGPLTRVHYGVFLARVDGELQVVR